MIRNTLDNTQAATFAVTLPDAEGAPRPHGTGFFVSGDGLFITARHVVTVGDPAVVRTDLADAFLDKEVRGPVPWVGQLLELVFEEERADIAVLRVDLEKNRDQAWLADRSEFPHLQLSGRALQEGEPVYAFGYPLPSSDVRSVGGLATVALQTLRPRVTSAIVASTVEASGPLATWGGPPASYVLDKALNFGNSGGPIVATETGAAHAVCTEFQLMPIAQPHLLGQSGEPIHVRVPSLYGTASSLSFSSVRSFLESEGVPYIDR